jgi:hypothetical protein
LGPLGTVATNRLIVPAPGDDDGEIGGMMDSDFKSQSGHNNFLFLTSSKQALGAHPASYRMRTGGSFSGGKAAEA